MFRRVLPRPAQLLRLNRVQTVVGLSAATLLTVGAAGLALDHATHFWLEHHLKSLKTNADLETRKCGWDVETGWTGDPQQGGTDPALGKAGRLAVRNAWFSEKRPETYGPLDGADDGTTNPVDAVLLRTEGFLRSAINIAEAPDVSGKLHPSTLIDLLIRRAAVLERLGPSHLLEARLQYERAWTLLGGKGIQAARLAVKLGDLNRRLGQGHEALAWWARGIALVTSAEDDAGTLVPTVPLVAPPSSAAQRVLISALVSCSAFYATTRQLAQAQKLDEASLTLLRSIPSPDSLASTSPPEALHFLTLLHRSAILSSHLAEVLFAQRVPIAQCLQRLQDAATSSERVAYALAGTSVRATEQPKPDAERPLLAEYTRNPHLAKPASDLLRDARRSAADTWNLMGELTERMGPTHKEQAYEYYRRAVGWAGRVTKAGLLEPADSTLRDDWALIKKNYTRMKQAVESK